MNITSISSGGGLGPPRPQEPQEQVQQNRLLAPKLPDTTKAEKRVSSEELLDRIKELADNGTYSVQFELNEEIDTLVVRVVNKTSGEVVRQIPSEELLKTIKALHDMRGLMVNTER
ncbi:MAG: hypothetical protein Kow00100_17510 [Geothermobacteraceae bacterium]